VSTLSLNLVDLNATIFERVVFYDPPKFLSNFLAPNCDGVLFSHVFDQLCCKQVRNSRKKHLKGVLK
jgi:hypothetical protein